jgi:hypothetical protein
MTAPIRRMIRLIRHELVAWALAGVTLHWLWTHGADKWSVALVLATLGLHPRPSQD